MDRKRRNIAIREMAGFVLLLLLLLAGMLSAWYGGRQQEQISGSLEDSAWLALSGQWEKARNTAEEARKQWEKSWYFRAAFSDHKPMEEVDRLFGELSICSAAGERTEFARICTALARQMDAIARGQKLSWWNVL